METGCMSCGIYTDTPARKVLQTSSCTIFSYKFVLQTVLGMGMRTNVTAQCTRKRNNDRDQALERFGYCLVALPCGLAFFPCPVALLCV